MEKLYKGLSVLFFVGLVGLLIVIYVNTGWRCVEGKCERSLGGQYSSKDKCNGTCDAAQQSQIDMSPSDNSYVCNSHYQCVEVPGSDTGTYTTAASCSEKCQKPVTTNYNPYYNPYSSYYPQTLSYRRPVYWNARRNPWNRRGRGRRGGRRDGRRDRSP